MYNNNSNDIIIIIINMRNDTCIYIFEDKYMFVYLKSTARLNS